MSIHVKLILEPPAPGFDHDDQFTTEPFRRTTFEVWERGRLVAVAGHSWRNRSDALMALERLLDGRVQFDRHGSRRGPTCVHRNGFTIPIVLVR